MNGTLEPKLAPAGAGLPAVELAVARLLFAFRRRFSTREALDRRFALGCTQIRERVAGLGTEEGGRRVLIPRLPGLEDSSRFWSVWMTLEHLRIVNTSVTTVIQALGRGVVPPGKASTAAVKPSTTAGPEALAAFEASCEGLVRVATEGGTLRTGVRFAHPWFGPLDAFGWYLMAGIHLGIHRDQIRRIRAGLRVAGRA